MTIRQTSSRKPRGYTVRDLSAADERAILKDLKEEVETWCASASPGASFALRDLLGGARKDWTGTPLQVLYDKHAATRTHEKAYARAAVEGGWLLKKVLDDHDDEFESESGFRARRYRRV